MKKLLLALSTAFLISCGNNHSTPENTVTTVEQNEKKEVFYPEIEAYIEKNIGNFDEIEDERKAELKKLSLYIQSKKTKNEKVELIFICTHNSRRSHLSQFWAMVAADYYSVNDIYTYSGGTEATAFNPRSVACLQRAGFKINKENEAETENPVYEVSYKNNQNSVKGFSKKYNDESNPKENFAAVMTCSHADKNCPLVLGASFRVAIPYTDPKFADNSPKEEATYDERCKQIANEMFYIFSLIKA